MGTGAWLHAKPLALVFGFSRPRIKRRTGAVTLIQCFGSALTLYSVPPLDAVPNNPPMRSRCRLAIRVPAEGPGQGLAGSEPLFRLS